VGFQAGPSGAPSGFQAGGYAPPVPLGGGRMVLVGVTHPRILVAQVYARGVLTQYLTVQGCNHWDLVIRLSMMLGMMPGVKEGRCTSDATYTMVGLR
jgi:hypothetical protein